MAFATRDQSRPDADTVEDAATILWRAVPWEADIFAKNCALGAVRPELAAA